MPLARLPIPVSLVFLAASALCAQNSQPASEPPSSSLVLNRAPLQPNAFYPLPLGAVKPGGWLKRQEEIQADGLTGHLDEFWNDVGPNSGWLGGTGESWERGPYYLDGLLPLAYQLDAPKLVQKAKRWVDWTLQSQKSDGQFGPSTNNDWWPRMVMVKVLTQYQEVSGDPRVLPFLTRYFHFEFRELPNRPLRDWGKYRWQDNAYAVLWLYNRTGNTWLLDLAKLLHKQGYDWETQFANFTYSAKQTEESTGLAQKPKEIPDAAMQTHGVNNAMALKAAPIWWLVSGNQADRTELHRQLAMLDRFHGLPNGMFSADEHLAGLDPSQGTELCTVVEAMFSYEQAFAILGSSVIADRLERVAYNALPATLSNDIWSHQYDQQPNQIACTRAHRQWSTNGPDSNLFGLAPNFGCCTANLHQGWPKFVTSLWMATPDDGLVTIAYAPSEVHAGLHGAQVAIQEETAYPFRGDIKLILHLDKRARFPLVLRIPDWAGGAEIRVNGQPVNRSAETPAPQGFFRLTRQWSNNDIVTIQFAMRPRVTHWYRNSAVFERGPLVFSLPLDGQWKEIKKYTDRSGDWQIDPTRPWNYAVQIGACDAVVREDPAGEVPFDAKNPTVSLVIHARRLPQWSIFKNSAGPLPISPASSTEPLERLALVPYGAAKLRITAFPYLDQASRCSPSSASAR